tara:strand:+ start:4705 stop:8280 length:3576 start_codon:yes stop_codon:yes gene_type:complete
MVDTIGTMILVMIQILILLEATPMNPDVDNATIHYGRDIRPILSDRCFHCHGPDDEARQASLRLDLPESATTTNGRRQAIVPGDAAASAVWQRISSLDPNDQMPPPDSGKHRLDERERELIRQWIEEGAIYEAHWSFEPLVKPQVPELKEDRWSRNEIDRFILQAASRNGYVPNEEADRATLARRLFLDLTGLPPSTDELNGFLNDERADAYVILVDRLLNEEPYRTRYAERMATPWLDLARYGDTSGIHMDAGRSIWPWRDWVIEAYRRNMPFDEFVIDQLAGDLVDQPTPEQIIASGFNRNHVTSDEGGAIDDEYRLMYAIDRTNTVGSVFLGMTVGCAQCHDHKFDPISIDEYYSLLAFFNNNEEPGIYSQLPDPNRAMEPAYEIVSEEERERLAELDAYLKGILDKQAMVDPDEREAIQAFRGDVVGSGNWLWETGQVGHTSSSHGTLLKLQSDGSLLASGPVPDVDDYVITISTDATDLRSFMLEFMEDPSLPNGRVGRAANGNAIMSGLSAEIASSKHPQKRRTLDLAWAWADTEQPDGDFRITNVLRPDDGRVWAMDTHRTPGNRVAIFTTDEPFGYDGGSDITLTLNFHSPYPRHSPGRVRAMLGRPNRKGLDHLPPTRTNWYIVGPFTEGDEETHYETAYGPEESGPLRFDRKYLGQSWRHAPGMKDAQDVTLAAGPGAEYVGCEIYASTARNMNVSVGSDDGIMVYRNGQLVHENRINRGLTQGRDELVLELEPGRNTLVYKIVNTGGPGGIYHDSTPQSDEYPIDTLAYVIPEDIAPEHSTAAASIAWRRNFSPGYLKTQASAEAAREQIAELKTGIPLTMVMREKQEIEPTYVMMRGAYDQPDHDRPVQRGVPAILGSIEMEGTPDRADLARWLVGDENPITARVTINRIWDMLFGRGLVDTVEDFGYQGSWPTHPELLDWLAADLRSHDWNIQHLLRTIVLSSTYRQSSRSHPRNTGDSGNHFYHRYPRQRLTAEQIRDQALFISGLLIEKIGGPGVKPYQPEGLWQEVAMQQSNTRYFERDMGDDLWRRSLYTYWKRAAPPPSMVAFDAPTREYCAPRRMNTNTPLQALVLWNDPQFVEAARVTAERIILSSGNDHERVSLLFRSCTGSEPEPDLTKAMIQTLGEFRSRFEVDSNSARSLISVGDTPVNETLKADEVAAWTMLVNAVLSSDAVIVKD